MSLPRLTYSRYIFSERPTGEITPTTFKCETRPIDELNAINAEQVLVQVTWLSLDPAMRAWLDDNQRSYVKPVQLGQVMRATGLGRVVRAGKGSKFAVGDLVSGLFGWTEYALMNGAHLNKLRTDIPGVQDTDYLYVLGMPGLTAYFGLFDIGNLKQGETLVVSGAAGAVGSVVCQIGKLKGSKVVAIAGGPNKCKWLKDEVGVDVALDYKSPGFYDQYKKLGILADVYFDNVGGKMLNFILSKMNTKGRVVVCGAISDYNSKPTGLTTYMSLIAQRVRMEGFIVTDYQDQFPVGIEELSSWLTAGSIKSRFHIVEGLHRAPEALPMLYKGGNTGKLIVKVANNEFSAKL